MDDLLVAGLVAYGLGSIPFGLLLSRAAGLGDIRKIGSGNIGATNVLRTGRRDIAAATLLLDAMKGGVAVMCGLVVAGPLGALVCGVAAVLGHLFPIWLKFKGGKGVATGLGVLLVASPFSGLACCAVWAVMAKWLKMSSAASLAAFAAAPVLVLVISGQIELVLLAVIVAALIFARHHENIARLLAGTEPRIGQK